MKKPKYIINIYGFVFLVLAISFLISASLSYTHILKVSKHSSVQDPVLVTMIYFALAVIFFIIQAISRYISKKKTYLEKELIEYGTRLSATVEKVKQRRDITFGRKSPYIISYSYSYNGDNYHAKSHLLWDKPNVVLGSVLNVYVNDMGKSAIDL